MTEHRHTLLLSLLLLAVACDPAKEAEREAEEAAAQAAADSAAAVAQAIMDSVAASMEADTVPTLDSTGLWDLGEEEATVAEVEQTITDEDWTRLTSDSIPFTRKSFDQAAIDEYLKDPDLDYDRVRHEEQLWWTRFMRWLNDRLNDLFGSKGGQVVFENLHWFILGMALLVTLWVLRKRLFGGVFGMEAHRARQVTEMEENIEELDLNDLLRKAEQQGDWRLALRYQWLKVLRRLVDEKRITWQPRSTDADYLAQLKDPALRATFSELSFIFKWVWYGDAPMDQGRYQRLKPAFEAAHQPVPAAPAERA